MIQRPINDGGDLVFWLAGIRPRPVERLPNRAFRQQPSGDKTR
jgi:hypothetical protein